MSFSLIPDIIINKVTDIVPRWLKDRGIRLLLLDFDNTILPYTSDDPGSALLDWHKSLKDAGITVCVVSNSKKARVPDFCGRYGIECLTRAKKPSTDGVERAIALFGAGPGETALVGDQIYTDVLAANRSGITSILCTPIHLSNIFLKLRHLAERPFIFIGKRRMGMSNLDMLKSQMKRAGVDALLLRDDISCRYITDAGLSDGTALIMNDKSYYFTDSRYIEAAQRDVKGFEIYLTTAQNKLYDRLGALLTKDMRVGFLQESTTVAAHDEYKKHIQSEFVGCGEMMTELRMAKRDYELTRMRAAQDITDEVFAEVLEIIRPGMTEKELAAEIIYRFYKCGADGLSFQPIVVSGANSSLPHGVPSVKPLENGDFITIDMGCVKDGYCSDMTRTVALGSASDEMREVYATVLKAQAAGIKAARAGVPGCDIDAAARDVIAAAGYGDYFGHGFGHGLGLEVHEAPSASSSYTKPLPEGCVISAEPGIYLPGRFGVRIEDVIIITREGSIDITNSPKNLIVI